MSPPYQPGQELKIQSHTPPHPYGSAYKKEEPVRKPVRGLVSKHGKHKIDHMSFVLSNPPLETDLPTDTKSHTLTLVRTTHHTPKEDGGGPYLVSCYLDSDESRLYVAKIYDGFGYQLAEPGDYGCDCMYMADMQHAQEAAAYQSIPLRFHGDIVPRYFGSWTFSVPTGDGTSHRPRPVRMILIEYVNGESMHSMIQRAVREVKYGKRVIDYSLLPPEEERLEVLGRLAEAEIAVWWYGGVDHGDVHPRNVMI
ncbi:hypothetical protein VTK56DRAFT_5465 [Thermocarpiscus australiensis]